MEKDDKGSTMIRMGVSGWMFLLVPAYPGCPGSKAVKRSLLLLWRHWLVGTKGIRPVKNWLAVCWHGFLERGADLHMARLMPLPLTVSCFSKIRIGFTFLVLAHPGSPGQRAVKRLCVCVCIKKLNVISYGCTLVEMSFCHLHCPSANQADRSRPQQQQSQERSRHVTVCYEQILMNSAITS